MKNLTTPKAILIGLSLIAVAIATLPFSGIIVDDAKASNIQKVMICAENGLCADVRHPLTSDGNVGLNHLIVMTERETY